MCISMKPNTKGDGNKTHSTERGEGGYSEPAQVILGFAGARNNWKALKLRDIASDEIKNYDVVGQYGHTNRCPHDGKYHKFYNQ